MQQQIIIHCTPNEFREIITEVVEQTIHPLIEKAIHSPHTHKLLTRQETARFLGISLPTLHEWTMNGVIQANRISTRVRYYEKDVQDALKKIRT